MEIVFHKELGEEDTCLASLIAEMALEANDEIRMLDLSFLRFTLQVINCVGFNLLREYTRGWVVVLNMTLIS